MASRNGTDGGYVPLGSRLPFGPGCRGAYLETGRQALRPTTKLSIRLYPSSSAAATALLDAEGSGLQPMRAVD